MEQEVDNRPKWLLELENRKRKPRLAHEAGAGAPCLICNSACPGLDLHFWRKICKNCKCGRDDHDVTDDEFPQFDLLFGPSSKSKKRAVLLRVKKQNQDEIPFEWVPPDTSQELAADYMKALPDDKLPIKGSAGAAFRRQQLQKQLPLHDIDHKACDELSEQERKQFEDYLQNLKNYVGQGKVTKSLGARPFSKALMTPANATDVQQFSPQHKAALSSSAPSLNLRTPSSFISKNPPLPPSQSHLPLTEPPPLPLSEPPPLPLSQPPYFQSNSTPSNVESIRTQTLESSVENSPQGCYHRVLVKVPNEASFAESGPANGLNVPQRSGAFSPLLNNHPRASESNLINSASQTGDFFQNSDSRHPKEPGYHGSSDISGIEAHLRGTGRIDPFISKSGDLPQDLAERMLSKALLPPSAIHAGDIVKSTLDEKELEYIRQKLNSKYGNEEEVEYRGTFESRELEGVRRPTTTEEIGRFIANGPNQFASCGSVMQAQNPLMAELLGHGKISDLTPVHATLKESSTNPQRCFSTDQKLQSASSSHPNHNLSSTVVNSPYGESIEPLRAAISSCGSVASNVINSELLNIPIFAEEAISGTPMNTDVDRLREDLESSNISQPKQKCHKCLEEINVGQVVVTAEKAKNEVWHPGCFVCSVCDELLADLVYFFYKDELYCGRDLATHLDIQRCFACDELIFTSAYTVAEGHCYHVKHFCCWDCDEPLAGQQYTSESDRPLCLPCYQKNYAKTCNACNQVIAADQQGVAIKDLDFHVDEKCFCCFTCEKSLHNGKVGIKEDRLFCSKECITQFQSQKS